MSNNPKDMSDKKKLKQGEINKTIYISQRNENKFEPQK